MKQKIASGFGSQTEGTATYAPNRGTSVFQGLEAGLTELHGRKLKFEEIAAYAGRPPTTLFDWLNGSQLRQVECMIRLFELLPKSKRAAILNKACRTLPTPRHKRLAWRDAQITWLERIARQENGLTIIQGSEDARGFVLTALGHCGSRLTQRETCGVDVRLPERFVPVRGVIYLNQPLPSDLVRTHTLKIWASIHKVHKHVVLLNNVWLAVPELHKEIINLAHDNHVVVAETLNYTLDQLKGKVNAPTHLLIATQDEAKRIKVIVQLA